MGNVGRLVRKFNATRPFDEPRNPSVATKLMIQKGSTRTEGEQLFYLERKTQNPNGVKEAKQDIFHWSVELVKYRQNITKQKCKFR